MKSSKPVVAPRSTEAAATAAPSVLVALDSEASNPDRRKRLALSARDLPRRRHVLAGAWLSDDLGYCGVSAESSIEEGERCVRTILTHAAQRCCTEDSARADVAGVSEGYTLYGHLR